MGRRFCAAQVDLIAWLSVRQIRQFGALGRRWAAFVAALSGRSRTVRGPVGRRRFRSARCQSEDGLLGLGLVDMSCRRGGAMRFRAGMSSLGLPDAGEPVTVLRA